MFRETVGGGGRHPRVKSQHGEGRAGRTTKSVLRASSLEPFFLLNGLVLGLRV